MFKHWKGLAISLMTVLVLGLASTAPPAEAKPKPKPPPEPPPEPALPSYTMTLLPLPEGYEESFAGGMNNRGDLVGSASKLGLPMHAWLYVPGVGTLDLGDSPLVPEGWTIQTADDINESGQIAGSFWRYDADGQQRWHAYRYTPGVNFVELGSLPGYPHSYAVAINERGDVAGTLECDHVPGVDDEVCAFVWTEEEGMEQIVPSWARAYDMNEVGEVTGFMRVNDEFHAFRYSPPSEIKPSEIKDLGVLRRRTHSHGYAINNLGEVAGYSWGGKGHNRERAVIYSDDTGMIDLGTLSGRRQSSSKACAINDSGHVAGRSWDDDVHRAFVYTDEAGMVDLEALIADPPAGLGFLYPERMNDSLDPDQPYGQICGYASVDGVRRAFILTPDR